MKKEYELSQMQSRKNPYALKLANISVSKDNEMETWPKVYSPQDAPPEVLALAEQLIPQLLIGDHPAMAILRTQYALARVVSVELTGVGFYVNYEVPGDVSRTIPADFAGGDAQIEVAGVSAPAGCVLFVRDGHLAFLEGYTFTDGWPEHAEVLAVKDVFPLIPPKAPII